MEATSPGAAPASPSSNEKNWALAAHILPLFTGVFLCGFLPPLVIYLVKRDESPFVADQAKESLNFQITVFVASLFFILLILICIGILLLIALLVAEIVLCLVAAIRASEGKLYRYPFAIRLI